MSQKAVLASNNSGKCEEFARIFAKHLEITPQAYWQIDSVDETGLTFVENALIKARHAARLTNLPALADDSGLIVPSLNGQPGLYSARYAADGQHIKKLLSELTNSPDRRAYFYCVLVLLKTPDDPAPLITEGRWSGEILSEPRGTGGFGYDPIFYIPSLDATAAELAPEVKNKLSHRAQAVAKLKQNLTS